MKNLFSILGVMLLFFITSCSTVHVTSDYDRNANFDAYQSFAFHEKGLNDLKMNDLDKRRIVTAITNELKAKGMTVSSYETAADLLINISAKKNTKVDVEVNPWYNPWWGYGPYWGSPNRVRQYKEGTIILDFVDRRNNTLVWQGVGEGLNISAIESKAERIPVAVKEILEKYPPKK
ncbi:DUF4136 domain-containing protein [Flavobacteriaceae bacterium Ap0902]|nr:DUF4136 domain-containing protein [Flavobacteriaceae bacterium Ap0902]